MIRHIVSWKLRADDEPAKALGYFETLDDLDGYQVHPEHIKAAGVVGARVVARACVVFEV